MTQPEDDLTELSARNKEAEDDTVMSSRATAPSAAPDVEDDDATRMSARAITGQEETADVTRMSRRSATATPKPSTPSGRKVRSEAPPGAATHVVAERGAFGQPALEYDPRDLPFEPATAPPVIGPTTDPVPEVPDLDRVRSKREAARHRRLITAVVVVAVTAAIMTAAVIGIIALVRGQQ
ncbi:hypothetical protein [Demequina sp.]|uniref:hypothetical protein n=1 Tax=Demequina sp. TaxID=2050685 RepID=UPI003D09EDDC